MQLSRSQVQLIESMLMCAGRTHKIYLVGGAVRDILRGQNQDSLDFDFVYEGDVRPFAQQLADDFVGELKTFDKYLTAKIINPKVFPDIISIDLTSARTEVYEKPGALPNVKLAKLSDDLSRRDFTINAMALPLEALIDWQRANYKPAVLEQALIDQFNGQSDLKLGLLRVLHELSFMDDPTRLMRLGRYCARLKASPAQETAELKIRALDALVFDSLAPFRRRGELEVLSIEPDLASAWEWLSREQILPALLAVSLDQCLDLTSALSRITKQTAQSVSPFDSVLRVLLKSLDIGVANRLGLSKARVKSLIGESAE